MSTLVCTATLSDKRSTSSVWETGYARQGKYDTVSHRGLMVFSALANNAIDGKKILDIKLKLVSGGSGSSGQKTAHFYRTDKTTASGTSLPLGAKLGTIRDAFYSNTKTYASLKTTHNAFYEALREYLNSGKRALAIYVSEDLASGKSYSPNYLSFTSVVLTITYAEDAIFRYDGAAWKRQIPYHYNGTEFVRCKAFCHDGTDWRC